MNGKANLEVNIIPDTQCMVYLPAFTIKSTKCRQIYHTLSVWVCNFLAYKKQCSLRGKRLALEVNNAIFLLEETHVATRRYSPTSVLCC